jgi:hypothetical protein
MNVSALEVAVDDPRGVGGRQRRRHLLDERQRLLLGHAAPLREPVRERLAGKQLHRQELRRAVAEDVEDPRDVRVG